MSDHALPKAALERAHAEPPAVAVRGMFAWCEPANLPRHAMAIIACFVAAHAITAIITPLMCDEAYYWVWSKHLAPGYYDHPPMVALTIWLGTLIAGDTQLGVRLIAVLMAIPMSWAVYRTAAILLADARTGLMAAVLLNVTLMVSVGTTIVTPDAPLMLAASFTMFSLAKVLETGRREWWLSVGAWVGIGLASKYTMLFFGPAILIWLIAMPELRRWLRSPWPYLGGLLALAIFAPVIWWNAEHQWVSFIKQFGRAHAMSFRPRFLFETLGGQLLMATPAIFLLGGSGLYALLRGRGAKRPTSILLGATIWTVIVYFAIHSLHDAVNPNWFSPIYPALAIAAAIAATRVSWPPRWQSWVNRSIRWSVPGGLVLFAFFAAHLNTGLLTAFRPDQASIILANGYRDVADQLHALQVKTGAGCFMTSGTGYGTPSWLLFYMPRGTCVIPRDDRFRWADLPVSDLDKLTGKTLLITEGAAWQQQLQGCCDKIEEVAQIPRWRGPTVVQTYTVALLTGAKQNILDDTPAPELLPR